MIKKKSNQCAQKASHPFLNTLGEYNMKNLLMFSPCITEEECFCGYILVKMIVSSRFGVGKVYEKN